MNFWNFNSKLQGGSWGMEFMKLLSGNCGWDGIHGCKFWKLLPEFSWS